MAQVAIIVLLGFALVAAQQPDFKTWKVQNMKTYPDKSAENAAQKVYEKNVADIEKHNSDPKATYKQKVNSDSDKTTEELTQNQGSASMPYEDTKQKNVKSSGSSVTADSKWQEKMRKSMSDKKGSTDKASMPTSVDYSTIMPPVKPGSKLTCAAIWVPAAIALLEYWSAKNNTNKRFSEQYLIDCYKKTGACTAGSGFGAVKYTTISGIVEESAYPFTGQVGTCPPTTTLKPTYFMSNTAWINVNGDEEMMKMIVFRHGPALAFMDAKQPGFQQYSSGIYSEATCTQGFSQQVVIFGYGTEGGVDYWLVRNGWGPTWGINGYVKVLRGKNMCAIAAWALVAQNY